MAPKANDGPTILILEGPELRTLLDEICPEHDPTVYRLRVGLDGGRVKWKVNEGTWSIGQTMGDPR